MLSLEVKALENTKESSLTNQGRETVLLLPVEHHIVYWRAMAAALKAAASSCRGCACAYGYGCSGSASGVPFASGYDCGYDAGGAASETSETFFSWESGTWLGAACTGSAHRGWPG